MIQFDYITLTKTCYVLTKRIRSDIRRNLKINHPIIEGEISVQSLNPQMVRKILKEAKDFQNVPRSSEETLLRRPQMGVVTQVLKEYLDVRGHVAVANGQATS